MMHRALAGLAGVLVTLAGPGVASAEPAPPPDPAPTGPPAEAVAPPIDPFAAASEQTKTDQVGTLAELLSAGAGAQNQVCGVPLRSRLAPIPATHGPTGVRGRTVTPLRGVASRAA
jgi:hypothetical protein